MQLEWQSAHKDNKRKTLMDELHHPHSTIHRQYDAERRRCRRPPGRHRHRRTPPIQSCLWHEKRRQKQNWISSPLSTLI